MSRTPQSLLPNEIAERVRPHLQGRCVCVTGGAGFIGGHIVDTLISLGAYVSVIDDLSNSSAASIANAMDNAPEQIRFIQASILDPDAMKTAVEGAQTVFHLGALGSVPKSVKDPSRTWVVNATGTMRVLQAASEAGVERVVYSASSSAYGNNPSLPKLETMAPEPESPYAAAKYAGESLMRTWSACYGMDTVSLRYFNIFGTRQAADSAYAAVIPAFVTKLLKNESPIIFGDGEQTRDFTHVSNAVAANLLAAISTRSLGGQVVNIGAGIQTSVNTLADLMIEEMGCAGMKTKHEPERVGEVKHSVANIDKARELIGYEPLISLEQGLKGTVRWYAQELANQQSV